MTAVSGAVGGSEPAISSAVRMLIKDLDGQIETVGGKPMLPQVPSLQIMSAVKEAVAAITRDMAPARERGAVSLARASAELTRLCVGYLNKADAEKSAALFTAELAGKFPLWAIAQACDQIREGGSAAVKLAISPAFLPSVPQMVQLCNSIIAPHEQLRQSALRVAKVKIAIPVKESEEVRERMAKKMAGLSSQLHHDRSVERAEHNRVANEVMARVNERSRLAEYAAAGIEPADKEGGIPVSLSLLRNLGGMVHDQPESPGANAGGGNGKSRRR